MLWVLICTVSLTVCCYHVTYHFQSESTLYSLPECQESRHHIWSLSDNNGIRTHLFRKRSLDNLAKLAKWFSSLTFRQSIECRFTRKFVRYTIITYSQRHRIDKYSQRNSIIWPVWLNGWVIIYKLSGC